MSASLGIFHHSCRQSHPCLKNWLENSLVPVSLIWCSADKKTLQEALHPFLPHPEHRGKEGRKGQRRFLSPKTDFRKKMDNSQQQQNDWVSSPMCLGKFCLQYPNLFVLPPALLPVLSFPHSCCQCSVLKTQARIWDGLSDNRITSLP